MFVPRRQEHEIQPQSALHTARTAAIPFKTSRPRALGTRSTCSHLLASQRTPDLPDGTTQKKYQCLAVGELDNLIPPGTIAAFVIGDDRATLWQSHNER